MTKRHRSQVGNLQSLFLRLEELVLANSGQDEFDEVFKLVIAKLFDEKYNNVSEFRVSDSPAEVFQRVTGLLRRAENRWSGILPPLPEPGLTPEHLSVCVGELAQHSIVSGSLESFDEFFEFLVGRAAKGNKGQYFTPRHVVEMCVRLIDPGPDDVIGDPACGSGGFLVHALQHVRSKLNNDVERTARYAAQSIWGFDLDERAVRIARALMMIAGDGSGNLFRLNSLLTQNRQRILLPNSAAEASLTIEDLVHPNLKGQGFFDVILTNPPFAGEIRESDLLEAYDNSRGKARAERDVLFIERCVNLLKPGGRMAIVLPHNKLSSAFFSDLRLWVTRRCAMVGVVSLGRNVFMPHTQQKTGVVLLRKKKRIGEISSEPVFLAVSERDGKDSRGNHILRSGANAGAPLWDRLDHDLADIVTRFSAAA
jgi:type I restriction enzyme M protein